MCLEELKASPVAVIRYHVCYIHIKENLSNTPLAGPCLNLNTISFKAKHQRGCFKGDCFLMVAFKEAGIVFIHIISSNNCSW